MSKRYLYAGLVFNAALLFGAPGANAQSQREADWEAKAMREQNERFIRDHPVKPDSYKDTRAYREASSERKAEIDRLMREHRERMDRALGRPEASPSPKPESRCKEC